MAHILLRANHWCVSFSYTRGVRGDKWRSGVQKAAFSPSPSITSRAVRESDRRSLPFSNSLSQTPLGKVDLEEVRPVLFAEKTRQRDHVHVPLEQHQTNIPTVLFNQL